MASYDGWMGLTSRRRWGWGGGGCPAAQVVIMLSWRNGDFLPENQYDVC